MKSPILRQNLRLPCVEDTRISETDIEIAEKLDCIRWKASEDITFPVVMAWLDAENPREQFYDWLDEAYQDCVWDCEDQVIKAVLKDEDVAEIVADEDGDEVRDWLRCGHCNCALTPTYTKKQG